MENIGNIILGIMIPFAGTTLGAACVYFMKKGIRQNVEKGLLGFASGVMVAASCSCCSLTGMCLIFTSGAMNRKVRPAR